MTNICYFWSNANVKWKDANWKWSECFNETSSVICHLWSTANVKWKDANWLWSQCQTVPTSSIICYLWSTANVKWKDANWLWSMCSGSPVPGPTPVTASIGFPGIDATTLIQPWLIEEPWDPYKNQKKKNKRLELVCVCNGMTYEKEKNVKEISLSVKGVKLTTISSDVDVEFKLEE